MSSYYAVFACHWGSGTGEEGEAFDLLIPEARFEDKVSI